MNCLTCTHKEIIDKLKNIPVLVRKDGSKMLCSGYRCYKRPGKDAYELEQDNTTLWISEEGCVWEEAQASITDCKYHSDKSE